MPNRGSFGMHIARSLKHTLCADPESFFRGGPTLTTPNFDYVFLVDGGEKIQIPL